MSYLSRFVPSAQASRTAAAFGFSAICLLVPIVGIFQSKAIVPLAILQAMLSALVLLAGMRAPLRPIQSVAVVLAAFAIWALMSVIWANHTSSALMGAAGMLGNFVTGLAIVAGVGTFDGTHRRRFGTALLIGWLSALAVLGIELVFHGPVFLFLYDTSWDAFAATVGPFWLKTGTAVLCLLVWPVMLVVRQRWGIVPAAIPLALLVVVAAEIGYMTGTGALVVGLLVALLATWSARRIAALLTVITIAASFAAPFVVRQLGDPEQAMAAFEFLPSAALHRTGIWSFTTGQILEAPFLGHGMNASKSLEGGTIRLIGPDGKDMGESLPLHPHNIALQIWLELGLLGIALYGALLFLVFAAAARRPTPPLALGQLATALVIANVSYGAWQSWWMSVLFIAAAMTVAIDRKAD